MAAERRPFLYSLHVMFTNKILKIFISTFVVFNTTVSFSQTAGNDILEKFIKKSNNITSIDCFLEQIIYENNTIEKYKGRYRADYKGRFRIDYIEPSNQTVVSTKNNLLWYMHESHILYVIKNDLSASGNAALLHQPKISLGIDRSLLSRYLGIWPVGFFTLAHHFIFIDSKNGIKLEMAISVHELKLLKKRILDRDGKEIMKEIYGDYQHIGSLLFPCRVDVYARTKNGYARSISLYNNVQLNIPLRDDLFKIRVPKETRVLTYGAK